MTLITATTRLARELRREYDEEQAAAGLSSWPSAHIMPLSAWLSEIWDEWLYSGAAERPPQLLRPSEEGVIWEDIVRGSKEGNELLQVTATADAALDAWKLACEWKLPMDAPEWSLPATQGRPVASLHPGHPGDRQGGGGRRRCRSGSGRGRIPDQAG